MSKVNDMGKARNDGLNLGQEDRYMSKEVYVKGRIVSEDQDGRQLVVLMEGGPDQVVFWADKKSLLTPEELHMIDLRATNAMVQAAYKAGKEGKPLMVALNEEVTT